MLVMKYRLKRSEVAKRKRLFASLLFMGAARRKIMKLVTYQLEREQKTRIGVLNSDETWVYPIRSIGVDYGEMGKLSPLEVRRVRNRSDDASARHLNEVYWTYTD